MAITKHVMPVAVANRCDYGRAPRNPEELFISCDNLMAVKARLLLILALEKLGMLTPYKDSDNPTSDERTKLEQEIGCFQRIFDTH